jgi:PhzF family phenazine biosynthesis protein
MQGEAGVSEQIRVFQVDAFTRRAYTGNPAGVVLGADALATEQMQQLARELNNGDSVFALAPDGADHDLRARYFTPRSEAGFVGHATLALHAVLARTNGPRERVQRHRNGSATVTVEDRDGAVRVAIRQPPPLLGAQPGPAECAPLLAALGLPLAALDSACPPRYAGANKARLLIGVDAASRLEKLQPDLQELARLSGADGPAGYFVFTRRTARAADVESRMFCPALGIPEDPVSGNAHGMLAAWLFECGLLRGAVLRGAQGHYMQRPGEVEIALTLRDAAIESLQIIGNAVVAFETRVALASFS